jgi:4-amino-4-deoxy-L-arabinose transferase-like glycosyltransferase
MRVTPETPTADPTPSTARPWLLALGAAGALAAYAYGLDSIFAPTIGDESLYLQIARTTARSGHLLPLVAESGINDTKPPLLFWQGILSTGFGSSWDLWHLRLPIVLLSLLTAALAGRMAARISGGARTGLVAGLVYLGFLSTVQYGRPFLTNAGEVLFLFLPLALIQGRERPGPALGLACGLSFGVATLYKSFFLVVPGTFALGLVLWHREGGRVGPFLRRHAAFLAIAAGVGLAVFGLWPALDPRRDVIWSQFVVGENVGKFQPLAFVDSLFHGDSTIWEIWLGDLKNAGLYAPLLLALLWDLWTRRRAIPPAEAELWLYVLAFLIVYSFPTQRQGNYLLPTMAALAVLLALRWEALSGLAFRVALGLLAVAGLALPAFQWMVERRLGTPLFPASAIALPLALGGLSLAGAVAPRFGRAAFPWLALLALAAGSAVIAPFSRPFPPTALAEVEGKPVLVPDRFAQSQERYRFLLPGADVRGYPCPAGPVPCAAPQASAGLHAAIYRELGERLPPGFEPLAALPHFKGRHSPQQIMEILGGRLELLVEWLVLARPVVPRA